MAQHKSYNIVDHSGTSFRTDLNDYLKAILSNNAGPTEPINPLPGKFWYDSVNNQIKVRNSANTGWTVVCSSVTGEVNSVSTTVTTDTVDGYEASVTNTPNTIIQRDGTGDILTNVVGNAPNADVTTIGGYTEAYLTDMQNVTGRRNYFTATEGDYIVYSQQVTDRAVYLRMPFSGEARFFWWHPIDFQIFDNSTWRVTLPGGSVTFEGGTSSASAIGEIATALGSTINADDPSSTGAFVWTLNISDWNYNYIENNIGVTVECLDVGTFKGAAFAIGINEYGMKYDPVTTYSYTNEPHWQRMITY